MKRGRRVLEASMEFKADRRRATLFLFLSRVLKIVVFFRCEWQRFEHESHARRNFSSYIHNVMSSPG
jgi:hypothetical protein